MRNTRTIQFSETLKQTHEGFILKEQWVRKVQFAVASKDTKGSFVKISRLNKSSYGSSPAANLHFPAANLHFPAANLHFPPLQAASLK
jgi:hypothetical protein